MNQEQGRNPAEQKRFSRAEVLDQIDTILYGLTELWLKDLSKDDFEDFQKSVNSLNAAKSRLGNDSLLEIVTIYLRPPKTRDISSKVLLQAFGVAVPDEMEMSDFMNKFPIVSKADQDFFFENLVWEKTVRRPEGKFDSLYGLPTFMDGVQLEVHNVGIMPTIDYPGQYFRVLIEI